MGKQLGEKVYVNVNTGTEESPVWTPLGGQKEASFNRGIGTADVTDKDSDGWEEHLPTNRSWSLSCPAFLVEDNPGQQELEAIYEAGEQRQFQILTESGDYIGKGTIETLNISGAQGAAAEIELSIKGTGAVVKS